MNIQIWITTIYSIMHSKIRKNQHHHTYLHSAQLKWRQVKHSHCFSFRANISSKQWIGNHVFPTLLNNFKIHVWKMVQLRYNLIQFIIITKSDLTDYYGLCNKVKQFKLHSIDNNDAYANSDTFSLPFFILRFFSFFCFSLCQLVAPLRLFFFIIHFSFAFILWSAKTGVPCTMLNSVHCTLYTEQTIINYLFLYVCVCRTLIAFRNHMRLMNRACDYVPFQCFPHRKQSICCDTISLTFIP